VKKKWWRGCRKTLENQIVVHFLKPNEE
jgi:hypothetical protein